MYLVGLVSLDPASERGIPEGRRLAPASDTGPLLRDEGDDERDVAEKRLISKYTSYFKNHINLSSPK